MNEDEQALKFVEGIEELIETVVEISKSDPLKAYVYLQHALNTSKLSVVGALPMVWSKRKDHQKEVELVTRGHGKLMNSLRKEIEKLRGAKIEELYKEFFPNTNPKLVTLSKEGNKYVSS